MDELLITPSPSSIPPQIVFSAGSYERVRDFSCSRPGQPEERWEEDVSWWIKAPQDEQGALDAVREAAAEVWLYEDSEGSLIGFASLAIAFAQIGADGEAPPGAYTVPYFGIHSNYRGRPEGPREQRYAYRIFQGLINEAERRGQFPLLTLYVDPANPAYRGFYPLFGFKEIDRITIGDREWVRMARPLNSPDKEAASE